MTPILSIYNALLKLFCSSFPFNRNDTIQQRDISIITNAFLTLSCLDRQKPQRSKKNPGENILKHFLCVVKEISVMTTKLSEKLRAINERVYFYQ
jgi:hypothetical protein